MYLFRKSRVPLGIFLTVELILYYFILTASGDLLVYSSFLAIVVCFLYALIWRRDWLMIGGLACTVGADFCLVMLSPIQQLWGMVFFLGAQGLYAFRLHRNRPSAGFLIARGVLSVLAIIVTCLVLKDKTDTLALVSMCYYVNLILNLIAACFQFRMNWPLPIGFLCFLLCDTVIGLQVAAGGYLSIAPGSLLHRLIFPDFNLAWFFYLPSQVILSITASGDTCK